MPLARARVWPLLLLLVVLGIAWWFVWGLGDRGSSRLLGMAYYVLLVAAFFALAIVSNLHERHWIAAWTEIEPFDPNKSLVPQDLWARLQEIGNHLQAEGFACVGHFHMPETAHAATSYCSMFLNPDRSILARVVSVYLTLKNISRSDSVLSFTTRFTDGTELLTANNPTVLATPRQPHITALWLPDIRDTQQLLRIHQTYVQHLGCPIAPFVSLERDPAQFLQAERDKLLKHFVATGYHYLHVPRDQYRLTWKGAVLISFKSVWPMSKLFRFLKKRRTAKLLAQVPALRNAG
jgi:hypothetical protein